MGIQPPIIKDTEEYKWVMISAKSLLQKFHPCTPDYIKNVCQGRCCEGSTGILVTIHDCELDKFRNMGAIIKGNFLAPDPKTNKCLFKTNEGFCGIHMGKPFGCAFSPFTLSRNGVLIIRNRYRMLRCFNREGSQPAYISHAFSLISIFGQAEYDRICERLNNSCLNFLAKMPILHYRVMVDNDKFKKHEKNKIKR